LSYLAVNNYVTTTTTTINKAGYMTNVRLEDTMLCISAIHFRWFSPRDELIY